MFLFVCFIEGRKPNQKVFKNSRKKLWSVDHIRFKYCSAVSTSLFFKKNKNIYWVREDCDIICEVTKPPNKKPTEKSKLLIALPLVLNKTLGKFKVDQRDEKREMKLSVFMVYI